MSCESINALPRLCGDGILAGVSKVYMIAFKDLEPVSSATTEVYATSISNIVNEVGLASGKSFVEIGILKNTVGVNETLTKDPTRGTCFFNQSFTLVLGGISNENRTFVETIKNQPVAVIYKARSGNHYVIGLNGDLELASLEGGTGTAPEDLVGYTMTFNGISASLTPLIDSSLVPSLIS
jgi:hypothetical protein